MTLSRTASMLAILVGAAVTTSCDEEIATRSYPVIDTEAVTDISENGATLNATILNIGSGGISDHGFVYDFVLNPALQRSDRISLGETTQRGTFSALADRNLAKDRRYFVRAYAITKSDNVVVYGQSVEFVSLGGSKPVIEDFSPKSGSIGDTVLIVGSGFSNIGSNNGVLLGASGSAVIRSTPDSLRCLVPTSTKAGENVITLTVGQFTVSPDEKFTLLPISITSFPASVTFSDTITISGLNFPSSKSLIKTTLLGTECLIIQSSSTELTVIVPVNVSAPKSAVTVEAGSQTVATAGEISLLKPIISEFAPAKGTAGSEIVIKGDYFHPIKESNKVEVNGKAVTVLEASRTTLKIKLPSGIEPGQYPIKISVVTQAVESTSLLEIVNP